MLKSNNLTGFGKRRVVGGGNPLTFTYLGGFNSFSGNLDLGANPAAGERVFIVLCGMSSTNVNAEITGFTVAGNAATEIEIANEAGGQNTSTALFYREITTGGTQAIVMQRNSAIGQGVRVYRVVSGSGGIAIGSSGKVQATPNPSFVISAAVGDVVIASAANRNGDTSGWTTPLTSDAVVDASTNDWHAVGSLSVTTALSSDTITCVMSGGDDDELAVYAVFTSA